MWQCKIRCTVPKAIYIFVLRYWYGNNVTIHVFYTEPRWARTLYQHPVCTLHSLAGPRILILVECQIVIADRGRCTYLLSFLHRKRPYSYFVEIAYIRTCRTHKYNRTLSMARHTNWGYRIISCGYSRSFTRGSFTTPLETAVINFRRKFLTMAWVGLVRSWAYIGRSPDPIKVQYYKTSIGLSFSVALMKLCNRP